MDPYGPYSGSYHSPQVGKNLILEFGGSSLIPCVITDKECVLDELLPSNLFIGQSVICTPSFLKKYFPFLVRSHLISMMKSIWRTSKGDMSHHIRV